MQWELALQVVQTIAVLIGVVFGLIQLKQIHTQREVQAGIELLRPLQSPEMASTILLLHSVPENLSGAELQENLGDKMTEVLALLALFESLGPLIERGHVPIDMYAQFYRGPTIICWAKCRRFIIELRERNWPELFEWLQWLAERMETHPSRSALPAFEEFRDWKSPSR